MNAADLSRLADPFPPSDIDWKPGSVTRDKSKGMAMAYLTSRAVQDRLDAVCGPADWRNEFREGPGGGVLCGLSIFVERPDGTSDWVTKWDGADNTAVEAIKGGLSGSMKRAAVMWGIGRYLYDLPTQWVRLDERGRFAEAPRLPASHLPRAERPAATRTETARPEAPRPEASRSETPRSEASARPEPRPAPRAEVTRAEAPRGDALRVDAPRPQMAGQRRIVRPAGDGAAGEPRLGRP